MPSFQFLLELSYAIHREGDVATVERCRRVLRLSAGPAEQLFADAETAGLVQREADMLRLLPPGLSLATAMSQRLAETRRRSLEAFQPYTTYVPKTWWP
jgi:hypothetical protein